MTAYPSSPNAGWYRAHNALRADLTALDGMLAAFGKQLEAGQALTTKQASAATRFIDAHLKFLHHHHHNEDGAPVQFRHVWLTVGYVHKRQQLSIAVGAVGKPRVQIISTILLLFRCAALSYADVALPYLSTRFQVNAKVGADHKRLVVGRTPPSVAAPGPVSGF
jgi:hypothetical protein